MHIFNTNEEGTSVPEKFELTQVKEERRADTRLLAQHLSTHSPVVLDLVATGSTRDMRIWYTTRVAEPTQRSQISHIVVDSGWEKYAANVAETHPDVAAWAKNDHLGFHILYLWNGTKRKYIPDFLVRFKSGKTLVLEIKGEDSPQDQAKRRAMDQWVQAVNAQGGLGHWAWDVVVGSMAAMQDVMAKHASQAEVDDGRHPENLTPETA